MNIAKIKQLLESFYGGDITPTEEQLLQQYFNSGEVAEELLDEKELFMQLYDSDSIDVPVSLELKLENLIDDLDRKENTKVQKKKLSRKLIIRWTSIAASVAFIAFAGIYMNKISLQGDIEALAEGLETQDVEANAEYIQLESALYKLAENFSKGMEQLDEVSINFEKTNSILEKTLSGNN